MYATERQQHIVRAAHSEGRVEVSHLATTLDVTVETIRRDLAALEGRGLVRRVHGGALPIESQGFEPGLTQRSSTQVEKKQGIAAAALPLVDVGVRSILLDAGTTTTAFASRLPSLVRDGRELTVVTNSLAIASLLAAETRIHLHFVGGRIRQRTLAAVGSGVQDQLRNLSVDVAFLGTNGVHATRGFTTPNDDEAAAKRAMAACADSVVVLADSSKVGQTHLCRVLGLDEVDTLVTDTDLDDESRAELTEHGLEVVAA